MTHVKWIKIVTDIFDDEKILLIETLPDADSIIVIWFKLLCLAGKQNNSGVFVMQNGIPYTDKMLATIFRRKESIVTLALKTFEQFGMVEIIENVITIPNWGKHQTLDQIEKKTEYMREYMREYRANQRQIACKSNCKTNSNANVSSVDKKENKIREDLDENKNLLPGAEKSAPDCSEVIIELPLNDKTFHSIFKNDVDEWASLYPAVDIMQELRAMRGWLDANPAKRKTKRGIKAFVNSWLARKQDKGGGTNNANSSDPPPNRPQYGTVL